MAVTWTLKAADGSSLSHQPGTGSPLALKFTNSGDAHLSGYATELIDTVVCESSSSPVSITLTPDNSGYTLDQTASTPTKSPSGHGGSLTWTDGQDGLTTLTFTVPGTIGDQWTWEFGLAEPSVALRMRAKIKKAP